MTKKRLREVTPGRRVAVAIVAASSAMAAALASSPSAATPSASTPSASIPSATTPSATSAVWPAPAGCPALPSVGAPTFADEFTGDGIPINTAVWEYSVGYRGFGLLTADNISIQDNALNIAQRHLDAPVEYGGIAFYYTGGEIYTKDLYRYRYGLVEARIRVNPHGGWSGGFYQIGVHGDDPRNEIDGPEYRSDIPSIVTAKVHQWISLPGEVVSNNSGHYTPSVPGFALTDWHRYSWYTQPDKVTFAVDGIVQGCHDWPGSGDDPTDLMNIVAGGYAALTDANGTPLAEGTPEGEAVQYDYIRYYNVL